MTAYATRRPANESPASPPTPTLGLDYLMNLNRPAFEAMSEINGRFLEQITAINSEWSRFLQQRFEEDFSLPQQLSQCRTPQDWFRVYSEFMQTAVQQYQAEFASIARMGQSFTTETAGIVREKVEEAARELKA